MPPPAARRPPCTPCRPSVTRFDFPRCRVCTTYTSDPDGYTLTPTPVSFWPRVQLPREQRAFGRTGKGESVSDEPIEVPGQQGRMKRFELTA